MDSKEQSGARFHSRVYLVLLVFVVVAGLPIVAVPALRHRLQTRVETLRSAWAGKPLITPATASVGANPAPFPKEYERAQWKRPEILPKYEPAPRPAFHISAGGESTVPKEQPLAPVPHRVDTAKPQASDTAAAAGENAPAPSIEYRKGKSEQEAYDLLVSSNPTLAGMIKGSDPTLKFQDWSAASVGQEAYNVSVTFLQTSDKVVRKYIWSVKVESKSITPLSAYAREISK